MKEGIHPDYREVCFVDLSNGFKFVTRSCAQTKRDDQDGRRPRAAAVQARDAPASRIRSTPARRRASTRSAAASRSSATSSRTSAPRSKPSQRIRNKGSFGCLFRCRRRRCSCCRIRCGIDRPVNSPNPALVTQRAAQPPAARSRCCCSARPTCCPALFGRDPWKSADITAFGYMVNIAAGPRRRGWRRRSAACRPTAPLLPYWIGAAFIQLLGAAGSTRRWRRASRSRCCSALALVADLVRHLPPGAHRGGAAAAVRLRRRGRRRSTTRARSPTARCWR